MLTQPATMTVVNLSSALEFPARTVTAPDPPDGSTLPRYAVAGLGQVIRVGAMCNLPNTILMGRVYFIDSNGNPFGSEYVQFQTGNTPDWQGQYVAICTTGDPAWPLGGAKFVAFKVNGINSTKSSWQLFGAIG